MEEVKTQKLSVIQENPIISEEELGSLPYDELANKSRKDHQSIVKTLDNQDNGLCLVVLGGICLAVSVLFFILSFTRKMNKPAGIDVLSLQFWICIACAVGGVTLLTLGLVQVFTNLKYRIAYKKEISAIAKLKDNMADKK